MQITIQREYDGMMLRQFLRTEMHLSSKMLKHIKFREDGILLNGERVTVRKTLHAGDLLELALEDDSADEHIEAINLPLEILYEDTDLVVPAKPADMPTHPSHDHHTDTVANALAYRYRAQGVPFVFRPINRLDRNTSGLLLIARNRVCAGTMSRDMREGKIQKTYIAVLDGVLESDVGRIDACLHRTEKSIIVREVCPQDAPDADTALTEYRVLARGERHTLVEARPITGRTHQLRVHFAHLGHPITGDDLYGSPDVRIGRHALHAHTLSFLHPVSRERVICRAPLPRDMADLIVHLFPDHPISKERSTVL